LNSITDDTQETHVSDTNGDHASGGLRARLERYERSAGGGIQLPVDDPVPEAPAETPDPSPALEPISPELVLVDPELAARARALLPDPRPFTPPPRAEPLPDLEPEFNPNANRVVLPEVLPSVEHEPVPEVARRFTKRRAAMYVLALVVLVALAAAAAYVVLRRGSSSSPGNENVAPSGPPANGPPPEAPPSAKPPAPTPKPPAPTVTPRSFVWAPSKGAKSYLVQFYREHKEIFRAQPAGAHVVVPAHWSYKGHDYSLVPGRYRWSVRPRLRGKTKRYGAPIVLSQLVVQRSSSGGGQSSLNP
jgi:hypothetical protein